MKGDHYLCDQRPPHLKKLIAKFEREDATKGKLKYFSFQPRYEVYDSNGLSIVKIFILKTFPEIRNRFYNDKLDKAII